MAVLMQGNCNFLIQLGWIPWLILTVSRVCFILTFEFGIFRLLFLILALFVTAEKMLESTLQIMNCRLRAGDMKWMSLSFKWNIRCYNSLIICMNMSQFVELVSIVLMATGMVILITLNFFILRLYNAFPFLIWCLFPFINFIIVGVIQFIVPKGVAIAESAETFVDYIKLRGKLFSTKYIAKRTQALIPLEIKLGFPGYIFFSFKKSTKSTYYTAILNHTLNLVLAVP